jgi:hypothetical protein
MEAKTLKQILDESGIEYKFRGWGGSSELILNQKYIAEVFVEDAITQWQAVYDIEHRKIVEANKILAEFPSSYAPSDIQAWRMKLRAGLSQEQKTEVKSNV